MTKDIIRKTLELVKTDKMSDEGNIIYDVPVFLDYLFGTILRARYDVRWDSVFRVYIVQLHDEGQELSINVPHNARTYYLDNDNYFDPYGELEEPGLLRFINQLCFILNKKEDEEDIETLLPLTKKVYEIDFIRGKILVSDLEIVPYLLRRENNLLYSYKIRLVL
jgi:hypothetical protein